MVIFGFLVSIIDPTDRIVREETIAKFKKYPNNPKINIKAKNSMHPNMTSTALPAKPTYKGAVNTVELVIGNV